MRNFRNKNIVTQTEPENPRSGFKHPALTALGDSMN